MKTEEPQEKKTALQDGGHVYVSCSNCDACLMDIWITRPNETEVWNVIAECPFCGDKSYMVEIHGGFHPGGYGQIKEDDPEDDVASTNIGDVVTKGDTFHFKMMKASENAKPIKHRA